MIATTMMVAASGIAVSPEIAIATMAALTVYAIGLLPGGRLTALEVLAAQALVVGLAVFLIPQDYLRSLISFSQGGGNLPIGPAIHILFYACILLIVVPRLLAARLFESSAGASYACALGIASLAMVPPALGRCDASHVFLNGLGLFTVAFALFARSGTRRFLTYTVAYLLIVFVYFQVSNARTYGISRSQLESAATLIKADFVRLVARSHFSSSQTANATRPETPASANAIGADPYARFDVYDALGLPYGSYGYEKSLQRYLWGQKRVIPEKYMGALDIYDESQLQERISELARMPRIVVQKNFLKLYEHRDPCKENQQYLAAALLAVRSRPCVHEPLDANIDMAKFIDSHYQVEAEIGDYLVMKRCK